MRFLNYVLLLLFVFQITVSAQGYYNGLNELAFNPNNNFYEIVDSIQAIFDAEDSTYLANVNSIVGPSLPQVFEDGKRSNFKRWSSYWQSNLRPGGFFPFPKDYDELQLEIANECNSGDFSTPWSCIGPFNSKHNENRQNQGRVDCAAKHPDPSKEIFFVGTRSGGIFKGEVTTPNPNYTGYPSETSPDGWPYPDVNWKNVTDQNNLSVFGASKIVFHPDDYTIMYAATSNEQDFSGGILISTNEGETWSQMEIDLSDVDPNNPSSYLKSYYEVKDIVIDPRSTLNHTIAYAITSTYIYVLNGSHNGTWYADGSATFWGGSADYFDIEINPTNENEIWFGTNYGVYKSNYEGFGLDSSPLDFEIERVPLFPFLFSPYLEAAFYDSNSGTSTINGNIEQQTIDGKEYQIAEHNKHLLSAQIEIDNNGRAHVAIFIKTRSNSFWPVSIQYARTSDGGENWCDVKDLAINAQGVGQDFSIDNPFTPDPNDKIKVARIRANEFEVSTNNIESDCTNNNPIIYLADQFELNKSVNGGDSFTHINSNDLFHSLNVDITPRILHDDIRYMEIIESSPEGILNGEKDKVLIGTDGGLIYTVNGMLETSSGRFNYVGLNGEGLTIGQYYGLDVAEKDDGFLIAGAQDGSITTLDNGNWEHNNINGDQFNCIIDPRRASDVSHIQSNYVYTRYSASVSNEFFLPPGLSSSFSKFEFDINQSNPNMIYGGWLDMWYNYTNGSSDWYQIPETSYNYFSYLNRVSNIQSLQVAPSNPSVIYFSRDNPYYYDDDKDEEIISGGIYQLTEFPVASGNFTIKDISGNLRFDENNNIEPNLPLQKAFVTDIAIDPLDEKRLWVSLSGFNEDTDFASSYARVYTTIIPSNPNEEIIWVSADPNFGLNDKALPNFPALSIEYEAGSNDRIYLGTRVGLYYKDNSMDCWAYYGNGLPKVDVRDIDINYCSRKIRVATWQRSIWEADLPPNDHSKPIEITTNTDWTEERFLHSDLVVKTGATLTIGGQSTTTFIGMPKDGKIIVERGARLIVDKATIGNDCGYRWQGIDVWGNPEIAHHEDHLNEAIPLNADDPGVLILRNATTIRDAANGAVNNFNTHQNYGPNGNVYYDGNYFGGLIKADVVAFTNNQRSVQMMRYAHPNLSSFSTCFFTYDDKFEEARDQVSLWGVHGVEFNGCDFKMNWDATERENTISPQRPRAIFSIDAGFSVVNDCHFDDFDYGIYAANTGLLQSKPINIEGTESNSISFNGNIVSIAVGVQNELNINNCRIDPEMTGYSPIALKNGIYVFGESTNVDIRDNRLLDGEGASTFGVYVDNTTAVENFVRENRIEGWDYGIYAQRNNDGTFLTCNEFESREIDLVVLGGYVTENGQQNFVKGSLNENQGSEANPAGNLFTEGTCNSAPYKHVHTWQNESFEYYYETPTNNSRYEPICDIYAEYEPEQTANLSDCSYNEGNTGGGGPGPYPGPRTRTSFDGKKQSVDTWKSLLDGGDTDGLLQDVTASPQSTSTYDKLKAASPFVTEPNLRETAKGNMQNSNKFDVLLSNAPLRPTVMVDAHPHLSPAQYALLYFIMQQGNLSPLQALQQLISQEEYAMDAILGTLLEEYWDEGNETEAFEVLDEEGSALSQKRKMAWALQKGNWQQAQSIMDGWDTENTELAEFKAVQECNLKTYQMQPLEADEMEMLENVASSNNSNAAYACAILSHATGQIYCAPQAPLDEAFNESGKKQRLEVPVPDAIYLNPKLLVSPNPAKNNVRVQLPFTTEGEVKYSFRLLDNKGAVAYSQNIGANELYLNIDISDFPDGLYHAQLSMEGIGIAHSKLVVAK